MLILESEGLFFCFYVFLLFLFEIHFSEGFFSGGVVVFLVLFVAFLYFLGEKGERF